MAGKLPMRLIYFSPVWWQSYEQRPHKFVRYFRKQFESEVLWVQPYPVRLPGRNDFRRASSALDQQTSPIEGVTCLPVSALPIEPLPIVRSFNALLRSSAWKRIRNFAEGADRLIVGVGKPSALALQALKRLKPEVSFYDAMDNFPYFYNGLSRAYMSRIETALAARVDKLLVSSESIERRLKPHNSNTRLLHNACDVESITYLPRVRGNKVIFGYVGSLGHWFDWDLLVKLAMSSPEFEFRLVGPMFEPPKMSVPKNIIFAGAMPHRQATREMTEFSVGIIPFKVNNLTAGVDPIKYYEYICAGLPVISTAFGEMKRRGTEDGVLKVSVEDDARALLKRAAGYVLPAEFVQEFRWRNDWATRLRDGCIFNRQAT